MYRHNKLFGRLNGTNGVDTTLVRRLVARNSASCRSYGTTQTLKLASNEEIPFYGKPRPPSPLFDSVTSPHVHTTTGTTRPSSFTLGSDNDASGVPTSFSSRFALFLENAKIAFTDPTRADAVAAIGELTGTLALQNLHSIMKRNVQGRVILTEQPIVGKETIPYESLLEQAQGIDFPLSEDQRQRVTFGQAYGAFLRTHGYDPDERDEVKYVLSSPHQQQPLTSDNGYQNDGEPADLAYVMLRYRQCHDFWHALTNLPPTVVGELGLKWLELFQTGIPLAAFSTTIGSLNSSTMTHEEQAILWNIYLPWARDISKAMPPASLLMVYYEKEFETPLIELQERLKVMPAPTMDPSVSNNEA